MSSTLKTNANDQPVGAEEQPSQSGSTTTRLHHFVSPLDRILRSDDKTVCHFWNNENGKGVFLDKTLLASRIKDCDKTLTECVERCIEEGTLVYPSKEEPSHIWVGSRKPERYRAENGETVELNLLDITGP